MDRTELGERLCNWHGSMSDPIYAVGSFYVSGQVYPDRDVVQDAKDSLQRSLDQFCDMLSGRKVMVERGGRQVDLKVFAGYTKEDIEENISDLEELVGELENFMKEDY